MIIRQAKLFVALASLVYCSIDCTATAFSDDRMLDKNGSLVVIYIQCMGVICTTVAIDDNATDIANLNPLRYRSYYLDTGLNLYYLKTRYYDPEICRFTTIDDLKYLRPDTINGVNSAFSWFNQKIRYLNS